MVRIRLRRVGAKNQPSYRIVVADKRSPRDGRFIEAIGHYNPRTQPATMVLDEERALFWLGNGAQPSESVQRIMDKLGTTDRLARLKAGETLEALVAEAETEAAQRPPVDPRTRRDDIQPEPKKVAEPVAEVEAVVAEVEAVAEAGDQVEETGDADELADG